MNLAPREMKVYKAWKQKNAAKLKRRRELLRDASIEMRVRRVETKVKKHWKAFESETAKEARR